MNNRTHISIRIQEDTIKKLRYVAKYDDRSTSSQIILLINNCVMEFEETHGKINLSEVVD